MAEEKDPIEVQVNELEDMAKLITEHSKAAIAHQAARIVRNDDTPYYNCVLEEWMYNLEKRLRETEALLKG